MAIAKFEEALEFDPTLELDPQKHAQELRAPTVVAEGGEELVHAGDVEDAITKFEEALELDPDFEISASRWNVLCWWGSLWNEAELVIDACEQAVALAEGTEDEAGFRDSRGVARALTGDVEGAIEDFEFFVENASPNARNVEWREAWIAELRAGDNPFEDEATLEALRGE